MKNYEKHTTKEAAAGTSPDTGDFPYPVMSPSTSPSAYGDAIDQSEIQKISDEWLKKQKGEPTENEIIENNSPVLTLDDDDTNTAEEANSFEKALTDAKLIMEVRQTKTGFCYLPIDRKRDSVVAVDLGEEWATDEIKHGSPSGRPYSDGTVKSVLSRLHRDARKEISMGLTPFSDQTPRYWTAGEADNMAADTFIYRGNSDIMGREPYIKVSAEGVSMVSNTGKGGSIAQYREDFREMKVELDADISEVNKLWDYVNIPKHSRVMVLGALLSPIVNSHANRAVIFASGPTNSGKTMTTERLTALIDPKGGGETATETTKGGDLVEQAALGSEVLNIGNISSISTAASNAIARIGGGSTRIERRLYKNGLNSSYVLRTLTIISTKDTNMTLRDDVLNRIIPILAGVLPDEKRKQGPRNEEWEEYLPRFRGALLKLVSEIKKDALENPQREFSTFYRWQGVAETIERLEHVMINNGFEVTIPWAEALQSEINKLRNESAPPTIEWIIHNLEEVVKGSSSKVLDRLKEIAGGRDSASTSGWVESPRGLTTILREYSEVLTEAGFTVSITQPGTSRRKTITIIPPEGRSIEEDKIDDLVEPIL